MCVAEVNGKMLQEVAEIRTMIGGRKGAPLTLPPPEECVLKIVSTTAPVVFQGGEELDEESGEMAWDPGGGGFTTLYVEGRLQLARTGKKMVVQVFNLGMGAVGQGHEPNFSIGPTVARA